MPSLDRLVLRWESIPMVSFILHSVSVTGTICIHKLKGRGEVVVANLMHLQGSFSTICNTIFPTGGTSIDNVSASKLKFFTLSCGKPGRSRLRGALLPTDRSAVWPLPVSRSDYLLKVAGVFHSAIVPKQRLSRIRRTRRTDIMYVSYPNDIIWKN